MSFGWIASLPPLTKLAIGLPMGICVYAFFRWLIYLANKTAREDGFNDTGKSLSQEEKRRRLLASSYN